MPDGLYFAGFGPADANPDIGDSTITETVGLGAFAMAAAPAIVTFVGGSPEEAIGATLEMYEITVAESPHFTIPQLGFRGTPTGIDVRKVVELGITPRINTGIAHREAGVGQIGAGLVRPPMAPFVEALKASAAALRHRRLATVRPTLARRQYAGDTKPQLLQRSWRSRDWGRA